MWRIRTWFPDLDETKVQALKLFHVELCRFNQKINLISANTVERADEIHFADSIFAAKLILKKTKYDEIHDLGSGNGFPGIVLAVLDPSKKVILVDSDQRKVEFLKYLIDRLGLKNCSAVLKRIEEIPAGVIKCAVTRAWTNIPRALLVLRKLVAAKGEVYHMKGTEWGIEVASIPHQLCSTWNTEPVGEYKLPVNQESRLVVLTTHN